MNNDQCDHNYEYNYVKTYVNPCENMTVINIHYANNLMYILFPCRTN